MSGHSKWATIKRKKGELDARRGKVFTKLSREITTAARLGGGDIAGNPRLRVAVVGAKQQGMPADTIERALKKGTGELDGPPVEDVSYEGYGAGGVALLVEAQTDNRNRTSALVRAAFAKNGGNLGASGSVAWLFERSGQAHLPVACVTEEQAMEVALAADAGDVARADDAWRIACAPEGFLALIDALEARGFAYEEARVAYRPQNLVEVRGHDAERVLRLIERLDDLDDVQAVWGNHALAPDAP